MLNVGSSVVIKKQLVKTHMTLNITSEMYEYQGHTAKVTGYTKINYVIFGYTLDVDNGKFTWIDSWLERE